MTIAHQVELTKEKDKPTRSKKSETPTKPIQLKFGDKVIPYDSFWSKEGYVIAKTIDPETGSLKYLVSFTLSKDEKSRVYFHPSELQLVKG